MKQSPSVSVLRTESPFAMGLRFGTYSVVACIGAVVNAQTAPAVSKTPWIQFLQAVALGTAPIVFALIAAARQKNVFRGAVASAFLITAHLSAFIAICCVFPLLTASGKNNADDDIGFGLVAIPFLIAVLIAVFAIAGGVVSFLWNKLRS